MDWGLEGVSSGFGILGVGSLQEDLGLDEVIFVLGADT